MKRARLILLLTALLPLLTIRAADDKKEEKEEKPTDYTVKDTAKLKGSDHFDLIIRQVEDVKTPGKLSEKANTLDEAHKLLKKLLQDHPQKFYSCIEYKGWLIFSTIASDGKTEGKENQSLQWVFHSGYAIKKGTDEVCTFGFW